MITKFKFGNSFVTKSRIFYVVSCILCVMIVFCVCVWVCLFWLVFFFIRRYYTLKYI